jgi:hypothetical protein
MPLEHRIDHRLRIVMTRATGRDFEFGLGRMYGARREMDSRSTKRVVVFRTRPEALAWLGLSRESPGEA